MPFSDCKLLVILETSPVLAEAVFEGMFSGNHKGEKKERSLGTLYKGKSGQFNTCIIVEYNLFWYLDKGLIRFK